LEITIQIGATHYLRCYENNPIPLFQCIRFLFVGNSCTQGSHMMEAEVLMAQVVMDYHSVQAGRINPVMLKMSIKRMEKYLAKNFKNTEEETSNRLG